MGLRAEDPTIADLLKSLGYATGQYGKNHLGDRDEFIPTVHGFDEFFGNLYHLNAESPMTRANKSDCLAATVGPFWPYSGRHRGFFRQKRRGAPRLTRRPIDPGRIPERASRTE